MEWWTVLIPAVSGLSGGAGGIWLGARWARTGERIASAAIRAADTDARRADSEAEAIAISGLERLVQALEVRLGQCEKRHDDRDRDDEERDKTLTRLQQQLRNQGGVW